jgi:hypothetical protein
MQQNSFSNSNAEMVEQASPRNQGAENSSKPVSSQGRRHKKVENEGRVLNAAPSHRNMVIQEVTEEPVF